jgi:hypothetical protein
MDLDPLGDAIKVLEQLREKRPAMNDMCRYGKMEITFKDGVVYSVGPLPYLVRGKDFRVEKGT